MPVIDKIAKALLAGIIAGLGSLGVVLAGGVSIGSVTAGQWVSIAIVAFSALGTVYAVPNAQPGSGK